MTLQTADFRLGFTTDDRDIARGSGMPPRLQKKHRNNDVLPREGGRAKDGFQERLIKGILWPFPPLHRRRADPGDLSAQALAQLTRQVIAHKRHFWTRTAMIDEEDRRSLATECARVHRPADMIFQQAQ